MLPHASPTCFCIQHARETDKTPRAPRARAWFRKAAGNRLGGCSPAYEPRGTNPESPAPWAPALSSPPHGLSSLLGGAQESPGLCPPELRSCPSITYRGILPTHPQGYTLSPLGLKRPGEGVGVPPLAPVPPAKPRGAVPCPVLSYPQPLQTQAIPGFPLGCHSQLGSEAPRLRLLALGSFPSSFPS